MINTLITVLLTLLSMANLLLLGVLIYSGIGKKDIESRIGLWITSAVIVLNTIFSIGGVALW